MIEMTPRWWKSLPESQRVYRNIAFRAVVMCMFYEQSKLGEGMRRHGARGFQMHMHVDRLVAAANDRSADLEMLCAAIVDRVDHPRVEKAILEYAQARANGQWPKWLTVADGHRIEMT